MESDNQVLRPRYFLHLAYDGTNYCGWQVQTNAPSVQQTINEALQKLLRHPVPSTGCGRTDSGVHAKDFYMHFMPEKEIEDPADFLFRLNCVLPDDISIFKIIPVADRAHVRFDATHRTYEYYVYFDKSPFIKKYASYQGFYPINWEPILYATEFIKTVQDFTSLCLASEDFKTNLCKITEARWDILPAHHLVLKPFENTPTGSPLTADYQRKEGEVLRFTITSNRFLRGMVRKIVGMTLMVGKGKLSLDEFTDTVIQQKEFRIHNLASPAGLFLSKVKYPYID